MGNIHVKLYELGPVVQKMSFKNIRRHHGEHSYEICNLDQWFNRTCRLKTLLI